MSEFPMLGPKNNEEALQIEVESLRAQLLAARAEAFEEAAKMAENYVKWCGVPTDILVNTVAEQFASQPRHAFMASVNATANRIAAALRAKGAGK